MNDCNASAIVFFARAETVKADPGVRAYDEALKMGLPKSIGIIPEVLNTGFDFIDPNYPSTDTFIAEATRLPEYGIQTLRKNIRHNNCGMEETD